MRKLTSKQLKTISNKEKIITQIGCNMRYHPCIVKIKKINCSVG